MDYELLVIGAGPGGYTAALSAASYGIKAAVVEYRETGGTCLNRGCIPTKTLLHSSDVYRSILEASSIGIHAESLSVNIEEIFSHKRHVSKTLADGIEGMLKRAKVDLLRGKAVITAPGKVEITDSEGNVSEVTSEKILCATGSVPARPPIPGFDLEGVITSDELLEGTDHLYKSIVIIGGGVIGIEFATFYADLGCDVTIIEGADRLLPLMDKEFGQNLNAVYKKQGVRVCTGSIVEKVEKCDNGLRVYFSSKKGEDSAEGEVVLSAIGRKICIDNLFAESMKDVPHIEGNAIVTDDRFETTVPGIYAIGDVSAKVKLAHVASAQAKAFADIHYGSGYLGNLDIIPSCIYSRPEIASVGMTDAEAKQAGIPVKVGKCVMGANARTLILDNPRSFMKVVANADTGKIIGAHLMCENSTDMITQLSQAIEAGLTASQLLTTMRPHPTFEEALAEALLDLQNKLEK